MRISEQDISWNYTALKAASILMVVTGHYFGSWLWVPTSVALFIFAFASGFFTARRYRQRFDFGAFWTAKIGRLMIPLLIIHLFLSALLWFRNPQSLWQAESLLAFVGLSGLLDWLGDGKNASGLGAGMWFLTVLLLFYAAYPLLQKLFAHRGFALCSLHLLCLAAMWTQQHVHVGYMLWFTIYGFVAGIIAGTHLEALAGSWQRTLLHTGIALTSCVLLKLAGISTSLVLITAMSMLVMMASLFVALPRPRWAIGSTSLIAAAMLEIYLTHPYLPIHPGGQSNLGGYLLSLLLALAVALLLSRISQFLLQRPAGQPA